MSLGLLIALLIFLLFMPVLSVLLGENKRFYILDIPFVWLHQSIYALFYSLTRWKGQKCTCFCFMLFILMALFFSSR